MEKFRAYRIHGEGGKTARRFEEITLDDLDPGEVVVRARFSGIDYEDALADPFDDLPGRFEGCIRGEARGRVVVEVS